MLELPNIPRADVPVGASEADNRVIKTEGTPIEFTAFKPLPHWELGENLGIIDFDRGVKLSGTRFYVLSGAGARLQRALIAWMLDVKIREQGYLEIIPPLMVSTETATSTGHLPKNADTMYHDAEDDFWFIPTAEVPLTSLHRDETLDESSLPIYMTAYTPCFRREKMSAGTGCARYQAGASVRQGRDGQAGASRNVGRRISQDGERRRGNLPAAENSVSRRRAVHCGSEFRERGHL